MSLNKYNVYCILTRSSKKAAKFKQWWQGIQQLLPIRLDLTAEYPATEELLLNTLPLLFEFSGVLWKTGQNTIDIILIQ